MTQRQLIRKSQEKVGRNETFLSSNGWQLAVWESLVNSHSFALLRIPLFAGFPFRCSKKVWNEKSFQNGQKNFGFLHERYWPLTAFIFTRKQSKCATARKNRNLEGAQRHFIFGAESALPKWHVLSCWPWPNYFLRVSVLSWIESKKASFASREANKK